MSSIQGPALCLAPFASGEAPFDTLDGITDWARDVGFTGVSLPTWDARLFDLQAAADDQAYADWVRQLLDQKGLALVSLSVEQQGRLVAAHPAYDPALDRLAPPAARGSRSARSAWAMAEMERAARAALRLGVTRVVAMPGSLVWPYVHPGPTRPAGILETGFAELGRRWRPILDLFDQAKVDVCFKPEGGQDIFDGASFERFLGAVYEHPRARLCYDPGRLFLQQVDYVEFARIYRDRIGAFHVSDGEIVPSGRQGLLGGFEPAAMRAARPRSVGDGMIDLGAVLAVLAATGFDGVATLDWACAVRDPEEGARESAAFIAASLMKTQQSPVLASEAEGAPDEVVNRAALGLA